MLPLTDQVEIVRYKNGLMQTEMDTVINEHRLSLELNGEHYTRLICSPANLKELAVGHLFAEGIIKSMSEIAAVEQTDDDLIKIELHKKHSVKTPERTITTGLGGPPSLSYHMLDGQICLPVGEKFDIKKIAMLASEFQSQSRIFQETGGVHACALYPINGESFFMEDIGRHNAFDKVVGAALIKNAELSGSVLFTTGRIPSDMVIKAVHVGLPLVVSRSAPTKSAVEMARDFNITLCGFAREGRMNIYSVPERLVTL
ncbi:formate dehydrogenase accessory sulfurtransferase FdhD [Eubacteriales bacterium OttesenSCG-928-K08]|nr:formate dehydrogenase accessory sulfurtransferase FdhD [Eubacteriales bacterium OttesenSCG-928-K08]